MDRFKGGAYTGANLFAVTTARGAEVLEIFAAAEAYRKQQLKLLWHFGPLLALATVAGLVSMHKAIAIGARRLGVSANAVELPFADAGVDVLTGSRTTGLSTASSPSAAPRRRARRFSPSPCSTLIGP